MHQWAEGPRLSRVPSNDKCRLRVYILQSTEYSDCSVPSPSTESEELKKLLLFVCFFVCLSLLFLCMFVSLYGLLATHRLRTSVLSYSVFRPGCKPSFDLTNIYGNAFEWHLVLNTVFKKLLNVITIIIAPKSSGCLSLCMPSLNWSAGGEKQSLLQWRINNEDNKIMNAEHIIFVIKNTFIIY